MIEEHLPEDVDYSEMDDLVDFRKIYFDQDAKDLLYGFLVATVIELRPFMFFDHVFVLLLMRFEYFVFDEIVVELKQVFEVVEGKVKLLLILAQSRVKLGQVLEECLIVFRLQVVDELPDTVLSVQVKVLFHDGVLLLFQVPDEFFSLLGHHLLYLVLADFLPELLSFPFEVGVHMSYQSNIIIFRF